ncbi:hypothetical protein MAR621_00056 [Maribacter dokdonensis]|nr:hypothetical protein MAR621_00056 [Maribacter dokdonensis]
MFKKIKNVFMGRKKLNFSKEYMFFPKFLNNKPRDSYKFILYLGIH